jgi:hypothetical protein
MMTLRASWQSVSTTRRIQRAQETQYAGNVTQVTLLFESFPGSDDL